MQSLAIVILTHNEEHNLPACLESIRSLNAQVFVVDFGSTDATVEIAQDNGCEVTTHPFENYAAQRNWAFDNLDITATWTLCLDADERLTLDIAAEIIDTLSQSISSHEGYMLRKRTVFMGRWLRHGGQYPAYHLRLFKSGSGRCEDRMYDQHFVVDGRVGVLKNDYIDIITSDIQSFITRHNRWAVLEAEEISRMSLVDPVGRNYQVEAKLFGTAIQRRRFYRNDVYLHLPLFVRPFLLWIYAYIIRLGCLDGIEGLIFYTLQRFWFRFLIDTNLVQLERARRASKHSSSKPVK